MFRLDGHGFKFLSTHPVGSNFSPGNPVLAKALFVKIRYTVVSLIKGIKQER